MSFLNKYKIFFLLFFSFEAISKDLSLFVTPLNNGEMSIIIRNNTSSFVKIFSSVSIGDCIIEQEFCIEFKNIGDARIRPLGDSRTLDYIKLDPNGLFGGVVNIKEVFSHVSLGRSDVEFRLVYFMPNSTRIEGEWMVLKNDYTVTPSKKYEYNPYCNK